MIGISKKLLHQSTLLLLSGLISQTAMGEDRALNWPQWRGPTSNAYLDSTKYPKQLSLEENLVWAVELPGEGSSTPIVWEGNIYLTCVYEGQDTICCLDSNGEIVWQQELGESRGAKHRTATGANPSPTTDGEHVYAYFKSGLLVAYTMDGQEVWRVNLQSKFGEDTLWWDLGTSPVLTTDGVLIAVMQTGESYLVSFDKATGEVVWKVDRNFSTPEESDQAYTTPILTTIDKKSVIVIFGADHLTGTDPETGSELFAIEGFNPDSKGMWRSIASPTISDEQIIVPFGRGNYVSRVNLSNCLNGSTNPIVWTKEAVGSDTPSPVIRGNEVYVLGDKGVVTCLDFLKGEIIWSERLPRSRNKCFSSPLLLGNLLYCFRENGIGHVLDVDAEGKVISTIDLEDSIVAQPIPYGEEMILIRTRKKLHLFGTSK